MTINLRIDNCDSLPDGGPLAFSAKARGFEIGREAHLDWTLPDPNRVISGRHCEIRFENGSYWLNDVSRNGTFVNGANARVKSPYRLADGDRIQIGHYLISVSVAPVNNPEAFAPDQADPFGGGAPPASGENGIWDTGAPSPAPISRRDLMPPPKRGRQEVDFAEQYLELPELRQSSAFDPFAPGQPPSAPAQPPVQPAPPFAQPPAPAPVFTPQAPPGPFGAAEPGFGARAAPLPPVAPRAPAPGAPGVAGVSPFPVESEPFAPPRQVSYPPQPLPAAPAAYPPPQAAPAPVMPAGHPAPAAPSYAPQPPTYGGDILARLAQGAGVPPEVFAQRDPGDIAEEIGQVLRVAVEELAQLLKARAAAKVLARSSNRTMISAVDNNPLKFIPRPEEIIEVMFARRRAGYLDAKRSVEESFNDLKTHEFATYAAMQKALARLLEDLSPDAIEKKVSGSAFASKKGRAWDTFVATWEAKTVSSENGMLDVFLAHFAEAYEKASKKQ